MDKAHRHIYGLYDVSKEDAAARLVVRGFHFTVHHDHRFGDHLTATRLIDQTRPELGTMSFQLAEPEAGSGAVRQSSDFKAILNVELFGEPKWWMSSLHHTLDCLGRVATLVDGPDGSRPDLGFAIEFGEIRHGWAEITIRNGYDRYFANIAYGTDGMGQLLTAFSTVVTRRLLGATCFWDDEPGGWIVDVRQGDVDIELTIEREDEYVRETQSNRNLVFRAVVENEVEFAKAFIAAYSEIQQRYGVASYQERWTHPFPAAELNALTSWVREQVDLKARKELEQAIFAQVICYHRTLSKTIAEALGESHETIIEMLRELQEPCNLRLFQFAQDDGTSPIRIDRNSLAQDIDFRQFVKSYCPDRS